LAVTGRGLTTVETRPAAQRIARMFASPAAVLVILPALVIAAGVVVLLLGRRSTRETGENMARRQLVAQAQAVQHDVDFALDQADPVLSMMHTLGDVAMATPDALARLHDIVEGRPGITNATIAFPVGELWGTYKEPGSGELHMHVTRGGSRTNYEMKGGVAEPIGTIANDYDPRTRPHYTEAVKAGKRVWFPPRVFSSSGRTGVTVSEPVLNTDGSLAAVITLDYDVAELSQLIRNPPLAGARNVLFTADGTILAYPAVALPQIAMQEKRLLRHTDFKDSALTALFAAMGTQAQSGQRFFHIEANDDKYLASIAIVGGKRAGVDWYLATLVPEETLFGAMRRLGRDSIIASGAALAIAMGIALMFAWNILRMRRAVTVARERARSAEERAKELGSYRLVERLGSGGMGEVWRAEHQLLARKAAIKLVRPDVMRDKNHALLIRERFRREAQTLASMRSRHTIALYDYGVTDDGTFFYVMELLDGLDLSQLVKQYGPQPAGRVIRILAQACQSLAEAHDAGLLHRDIKPANLVLCRAADEVDIVKVLDFGIVHNLTEPIAPPTPRHTPNLATPPRGDSGERLTSEGVVIGTPGYIPPEQALAFSIDHTGDLYALGCVAWYLLTGREVYPRRTEEEVMRAHVYDPVPSIREVTRNWVPIALEELLRQCLAKHPAERPPDARTLAQLLKQIVVPIEHAWTEAQAAAWWSAMRRPTTEGSAADTERVLVVPQRSDNQGGSPEAMTIAARRSARTY